MMGAAAAAIFCSGSGAAAAPSLGDERRRCAPRWGSDVVGDQEVGVDNALSGDGSGEDGLPGVDVGG